MWTSEHVTRGSLKDEGLGPNQYLSALARIRIQMKNITVGI